MRKKGAVAGSMVLFIGMFFVLVAMIFIGITVSVGAFYGKGYDFREVEAQDLYNVVEECFLREEIDFYAPGQKIVSTA